MLFFLVIVAVPFAILLVGFFRPDLVEQVIREPSGAGVAHQSRSIEQPDKTLAP
jgi:hypothetical protein